MQKDHQSTEFQLSKSPVSSDEILKSLHTTLVNSQTELRKKMTRVSELIEEKTRELQGLSWVDQETARKTIIEIVTRKVTNSKEQMMQTASVACLATSHATVSEHNSGRTRTREKKAPAILESEIFPYDLGPFEILSLMITPQQIEKFADDVVAKTGCAETGLTPENLEKRTSELVKEISELRFQQNRAAEAVNSILTAGDLTSQQQEPPPPPPPPKLPDPIKLPGVSVQEFDSKKGEWVPQQSDYRNFY